MSRPDPLTAYLAAGTTEPVPGRCPACRLPSLVAVPVVAFLDVTPPPGAAPAGTVTACTDCGHTIPAGARP